MQHATRKADGPTHTSPLFPLTPDVVRRLREQQEVATAEPVLPLLDDQTTTHERPLA